MVINNNVHDRQVDGVNVFHDDVHVHVRAVPHVHEELHARAVLVFRQDRVYSRAADAFIGKLVKIKI